MREEGRRGERLEEAGEHTEGGGQGALRYMSLASHGDGGLASRR